MYFDPAKHRSSARMRGYDYSTPGAYFVSLCTQNRESLFGEVVNRECRLNTPGGLVEQAWNDVPHHYLNVGLDTHILMPNQLHGIIVLMDVDAVPRGMGPLLGEVVRLFKKSSTARVNEFMGRDAAHRIWHSGYHERVIRNDLELRAIRQYIREQAAQQSLIHQTAS